MGEMNPTACQSSIRGPLSGNASECHGFTLPRSFKPARHEMRPYKALYGLLMAHRCPNPPRRENGHMGPSRGSQGGTFTFYSTSLERSSRVQDAGQRNAKVRRCIVHCSM